MQRQGLREMETEEESRSEAGRQVMDLRGVKAGLEFLSG